MDKVLSREHIEIKPGVCGGKPVVLGTRIRVWDIHVWIHMRGKSPEEVVAEIPQLTVADVHAALTYYFDHREDIERQMQEAEAVAERLQAEQGPTKFSRLREQLLKATDDHNAPVLPG